MKHPITVRIVRARSEPDIRQMSDRAPNDLLINAYGRQFARNGLAVTLAPMDAMLLTAIIGRRGGVAAYEDLIEIFYGHRADGGPSDPMNVLDTRITYLNPIATLLGYKIERVWGQGLRAFPALFERAEAA